MGGQQVDDSATKGGGHGASGVELGLHHFDHPFRGPLPVQTFKSTSNAGYAALAEHGCGTAWVVHEGPYAPPGIWSPTCQHIAWVGAGQRLNDTKGDGVLPYNRIGPLTVRPAGPVVHMVVHETAKVTIYPLWTYLAEGGWAPHIGPSAQKDRDATVLYATNEATETATTIARSLPGGATVELMTWPSPADIVVAAGRSVTQ